MWRIGIKCPILGSNMLFFSWWSPSAWFVFLMAFPSLTSFIYLCTLLLHIKGVISVSILYPSVNDRQPGKPSYSEAPIQRSYSSTMCNHPHQLIIKLCLLLHYLWYIHMCKHTFYMLTYTFLESNSLLDNKKVMMCHLQMESNLWVNSFKSMLGVSSQVWVFDYWTAETWLII